MPIHSNRAKRLILDKRKPIKKLHWIRLPEGEPIEECDFWTFPGYDPNKQGVMATSVGSHCLGKENRAYGTKNNMDFWRPDCFKKQSRHPLQPHRAG